ncbi:hypothetical protein MKW92_004201, partial [Papaver armeniacum]
IWRIRGGLSVKQTGIEYYLIRFEWYHEFVRVVRNGSRAIMNDTFMLSVWHEDQPISEVHLTHVELNITIRGLTVEQLEEFDDIRGYVYDMGEIIASDPPRLEDNELYAMTVRVTMNIFNTLRAATLADNGRGGINTLTFEYHDLPYNFCIFCRRLGHRQEACAQYLQAQNLIQRGYQLPAPPALYPPLHMEEHDGMENLEDDADDEHGLFASDNDSHSSHNSAATNKTEMNIRDYDEAIIPGDNEESPMKILKPDSPIFVANPHQWNDIDYNHNEPYINPQPYEITWIPNHTPSAKRPNPSHYLYNFLPENLEEFQPMDLFLTCNSWGYYS